MILDYLNQCINCGICISSCPTYKLNLNELYSPRGRLILLQEYFKEKNSKKIDKQIFKEAFQTCLNSGQCQKACPIGVNTKLLLKFGKEIANDI
ncbi:(Fe-S)-binding protein [Caldifermentibacillus hisashii]|uniref:(Fe-S)-binding protein n=1 Tax=Caldifermentibacillus hisashii TaxID=996558 RepID=A0ABU9JUC6_9BACI